MVIYGEHQFYKEKREMVARFVTKFLDRKWRNNIMDNMKKNSLKLYLNLYSSLRRMSDKFASIGINIEEGERSKSETIQDDFTDIQMTIDDYIIKTLDINEECDGEEFFELVHECHYGNKNIEDVIASVEEFIENRELLRRMDN